MYLNEQRGIIDFPAFIKALCEVGYTGVCSLEHERNMDFPVPTFFFIRKSL
jgi:sugar phosphate isomerase/epimerase